MVFRDYEWFVSVEMKASYYMDVDKYNDALLLETDIPHPYRLFVIEKCHELQIKEDNAPDIVFCQALYDLEHGFESFYKSLGFIEKPLYKSAFKKRFDRIKSVVSIRKRRKEMYPSLSINPQVHNAMQADLSNYRHYAAYHMRPDAFLVKNAAQNMAQEYYRRTHG